MTIRGGIETIEDASFGRLLRQYRLAAGLSQEALAELAHMSARGISDLERGVRTTPYRATVLQLAAALELDGEERATLERAARRRPLHNQSPAETDLALLTTKLTIPSVRTGLVNRTRLIERLSQGVRGPLTLISAPAGWGKTTLLAVWRAASGADVPMAWVSLDTGDNDATRFWSYVVAAVEGVTSRVGAALHEMLRSPQPASWESVVTLFINDLAPLPQDLLLVLDDYHVIENPDLHGALNVLVERMPSRLHLLISSRADPPLPLARLRARGTVTEIRAADLRFTSDEASAFLTSVMGLSLPEDAIASLEDRTEGWIAGLQLAALSLQGRPPEHAASFITAFAGSHRYIVDYLMDEVLLQQPSEIQHFLLSTSILDRLSAPLCATVLHGVDPSREQVVAAQGVLERLDRQNLFLVALDSERRCYRYHHLFAEALRLRLETWCGDVEALHQRAADWYEGQNLLLPAISHSLAAHDFDRAGDLLVRAAPLLFARGEMETLMGVLGSLPDSTVRARPRLAVICALGRIDARDPDGAENYLESAAAALHTVPAGERRLLRADIAVTRSNVFAMRGDASAVIPLIDGVRADLDGGRTATRGLAAMSTGFALLYQGAPLAAAESFHEGAEVNRLASNAYAMLLATMGESYAWRAGGATERAITTCRAAIRWSEERSHPSPIVATLYANLADLHRERNELDAARRYVERAVESALTPVNREGRWLEWRLFSDLVRARVWQAQGDLLGARDAVSAARARLQGVYAAPLALLFNTFEAQMDLSEGKIDAAMARLTGMDREPAPHLGLSPQFYVYAYEHLAVAPIQLRIALARDGGDEAQLDAAGAMLLDVQRRTEAAGLTWLQVKALALDALIQAMRGDDDAALSTLLAAVQQARSGPYVRIFLDEGEPLISLLRRLHSGGPNGAEVKRLLEAWRTGSSGKAPAHALPEPLTQRERDVLRLLAAKRTNAEIAGALFLGTNTVKTHLKSLYAKLGVHSRGEAIHRAHTLGLL